MNNDDIYIDSKYRQGEFSDGAPFAFELNYGSWNNFTWREILLKADSIWLVSSRTGEKVQVEEIDGYALGHNDGIDCCQSRLKFDAIEVRL
ncbi:hypothetical protein A1QO_04220 [Vibrio genomosp. F10 str. ZF-129]|uniref:Uncharacterized protein n=1 Tax=Vibrio genomosp. F10 str. ZF-129 TaxID=1187848 RepID=A0A1E5BIS2_9VIBR|nr:hypothetical protein [Vibrio genomosp. F10]OEE37318.1 hypothetical protein A1QO_04220 [Vibrio genomosp. F10 str. ZF-129]